MHGGDIYRNNVKYDFSVNTNPLGMPPEVAAALSEAVFDADKYPDLIHEELVNETAKVLGIEPFRIVYGNGASEILMALCHAALPEKIMVTAPSFLGYTNIIHKAYKDCGIVYHYLSEVEDFELKDDILEHIEMEAPSILFLTNPNNPNGRFVDKSLLERIVSKCDETGTVLLLDECFLPLSGADKERSMIPKISEHGNIVVLRAFTKSFAMAGVRLGYAVCGDKALAEAIRAHLPEWNLSLFAQRAGVAGLGHLDVIQQAAEYIAKEKKYLLEGLTAIGIRCYHSDANYILLKLENVGDNVAESLMARGILIRDCSDYEGLGKGYYRVAVKKHEENELLLRALRDISDKKGNK